MIKFIEPTVTLEELIQEISRFEVIVSEWDESQRCVVIGLKRAIESLHKVALTRFIKSLKQDSMSALCHAVSDDVVYAVLLYHDLVKTQTPPLLERIQSALDEICTELTNHHLNVEILAIKPPDIVEIRLTETENICFSLSEKIVLAIKAHCPEINAVFFR